MMYSETSYLQPQKPKRSVWVRIVFVAAIILITAGLVFLGIVVTARFNDEQAVKNELITQNKRLHMTQLDGGILSSDAIKQAKSTKEVTVRLKVAPDTKHYCIEASSKKNSDSIQYHMITDTPELQPEKGLCGDNAKAAPQKPENFTLGSAGAKNASFTWDAIPEARTYSLECAASTDFTSSIKTSITTETAQIEGLSPSTTYNCRVSAINSAGTSDWTNSVVVVTNTAVAIPQNLKISTVSTSSLSYSWTAVPGATRYVLEYATDPSFMQDVKQVTTTQVQGTINGLDTYKGYFFHVKAVTNSASMQQAPYSEVIQGRTAQ